MIREGEREWIVVPDGYADWVTISGSCMIEADNPNTAHANATSFTNGSTSTGTTVYPDAATEERLLLKFSRAITLDANTHVILPLHNVVTWTMDNDGTGWVGFDWQLYFITSDFDTSGGSCATWNSVGSVAYGGGGYPGTDYAEPDDAVGNVGSFQLFVEPIEITADDVIGHDPYNFGPDNPIACILYNLDMAGTVVYGVAICHSNWTRSAWGATDFASVSTTTHYDSGSGGANG